MPTLRASPPTARFPKVGRPQRVANGVERWLEAAAALEDGNLADFARNLAADGEGRALLEAVFSNSPFLTQCLLKEIEYVSYVVRHGPESSWKRIFQALDADTAPAAEKGDGPALSRALRVARRRVALTTALADLTGRWTVDEVTGALSDFADRAIGLAAAHHLGEAARRGFLDLDDLNNPEKGSGLIILGMGKLGGRELNYSSDIDLIVLYDPEVVRSGAPDRIGERMVRITQGIVAMLQERTSDGYVFRTDLRLRPDPGATPVALSTRAAETYYESMGQNWERAAMIKARPVAGDLAAGATFLRHLRPYVWRKNLDFAAIQDIHSIKRQINAHRGGGRIAVAGHNIKLGRGGIREIEFFAQTQQLIFGGRDPRLRVAPTCAALRALAAAGRISRKDAEELIESYGYLRVIEHRLQMIDDQQTHTLPEEAEGLDHVAAFLGYDDREEFTRELIHHLKRVEDHYAGLFEEAPALSGPGNLVFTGGDHDPETLSTLAQLGYDEPETISALIRKWHHGRYRATRSTRAREILTELMPALLTALARTAHPDAALKRFDEFLAGLPAGVQLFSLFQMNPELLDLVAEIMGSAPRLASHLSRRPLLFDAVLTADFFEPPKTREGLTRELAGLLDQAADLQDVLYLTCRWTNDRKFQIGVQVLRGLIDTGDAGRALSDVADTVIRTLLSMVEMDFARSHGRVAGGGLGIVALGKLGGREMSATSDLDLVFVYEAPEGTEQSDGEKPLSPAHYFARLSQRLLNALTAQTPEGTLYEVDMRLRPSGNAGPIASRGSAFIEYQRERAWTWEHMALTRARYVAGPKRLGTAIMKGIGGVLTAGHDPEKVLKDVAHMRERMAREHRADSVWQVKHVRGGLVDIEFLAQFLQLRHGREHPEILSTTTAVVFEAAGAAGCIDKKTALSLKTAAELWQRVQALLRLTVEDRFSEATASDGLKAALARAAGVNTFTTLKRRLEKTADQVHGIFKAMIEDPAAALPEDDKATPAEAKE